MGQLHEATHRRGYSIRTIVFWFVTVILEFCTFGRKIEQFEIFFYQLLIP